MAGTPGGRRCATQAAIYSQWLRAIKGLPSPSRVRAKGDSLDSWRANVAKHAQASVIDMRADGCDGALTLSISDDGIGGADPSGGAGIIGLKNRVEALGGTISILSPPATEQLCASSFRPIRWPCPCCRASTLYPPLAGRDGESQRAGAPGESPSPRPSTIRRIASADSSRFGRNPVAGLSAIGPAKSAAE
jgi:hypothetical protein